MKKTFSYTAYLALTLLLVLGQSGNAHADTWVPPGPVVGDAFPDSLNLQDQAGKQQSLRTLVGKNGAALFFVRSADWCPFCKHQLVDVNGRLAEFKALGLNVVSISHDEVPLIAAFHQSQSIGYTMLADPKGIVVEKLGIRDMQYADGSKAYGVARPMIFIVNPQLKITHKYAEESYRNRPDLTKVLSELSAK
ncbi:MAG: peroxiredoxin family protein [Steroidobacteraceae bacterium]